MRATRDVVAGGLAWSSAARVVQVAAQFAATVTLARLLAPRDFGLVNMAAVFLAIANAVADFGVKAYVVHRPDLDPEEIEAAKLVSWGLGLGIFLVAVLTAVPASWFYREPRLGAVLVVQSTIYLIANAGTVHVAMLARRLAFKRMAMAEMASSGTYVAAAIGLALAGSGYWSIVLGRIAASLASLGVVSWRSGSVLPRPGAFRHASRIARFGGLVAGTGVVTQLDENFDNIVVGRLLGSGTLGTYSIAYGLAALPQRHVAFMVANVANPVVARATAGVELAASIRRYARYQVLVPASIAILVSILAPEVVMVALGARWMDAIPLVRVMGISTALLAVGTVIGGALVARGLARSLLGFHVAKLAATALFVVVGARHGVLGAALGFLIAAAIGVVAGLRYVETRMASGLLAACSGPLVAVLAAAAVAWGTRTLIAGAGSPAATLLGAGAAFVAVLTAVSLTAFDDVRRDVAAVTWSRRPGANGGEQA